MGLFPGLILQVLFQQYRLQKNRQIASFTTLTLALTYLHICKLMLCLCKRGVGWRKEWGVRAEKIERTVS